MKLTTILLIAACLQVSANSRGQTVTLSVKEVPMKKVFIEIQKQTGLNILVKESLLEKIAPVTLDAKNMKVDEVLSICLKNQMLSYSIEGGVIVIKSDYLTTLLSEIPPIPPLFEVTVVVQNSEGQPLVGASVRIKGTQNGATTDMNGRVLLKVDNPHSTLIISYVGYKTYEVGIDNNKIVTVRLSYLDKQIEDVVVIGYGTRARKDVTTAISSIDSKTIEKGIAMNPMIAMQGNMSGVQVSNNGGNLMDQPTIRIRGVNTWGVADPLYVIDGIPVQSYNSGADATSSSAYLAGPINIMSMIDPNDIESISVLKDASAAAIYGVRAGNGVILITTKKGTGDKPKLEFSTRTGIANMTQHVDVLNTQQYTKHLQDLYATNPSYTVPVANVGVFDPTASNYLGNNPTYDWQNALKNKNALTQDYSMRLTGGTSKTNYYVSLGYTNQDGTYQGNSLERYNGSFKLNTDVTKWVRMGINYRLSYVKGNDAFDGLFMNNLKITQAPPWQPIKDPKGPYGYAVEVAGILPNGSFSGAGLYGQGTQWNFAGLMAVSDWEYKALRNIGNAYIEIEPIADLKIRGTVNIDQNTRTSSMFNSNEAYNFSTADGDPRGLGGGNSAGTLVENTVNDFNLVEEISVNYKKSFRGHNIDFLLNGMTQQVSSKVSGVSTTYMASGDPSLRYIQTSPYTTSGTTLSNSALTGNMARLAYNFQSKYYLDLTVRRDGSSRFAPDYRWGVFPSASAAWRISSESFMKQFTWLTDLKIRAGWGKLGNQEVQNLAYLSTINNNPVTAFGTTSNGAGNIITAAVTTSMPSVNLQWEKTTTSNIGFDATIKRNLNFSVEYYNKTTDGILENMTIPPSLGLLTPPVANVGTVRNSGIEITFNYKNNVGNLHYSIGGNLTTVKNIVVKTYEHVPMYNIEEGQSMGYIKGYEVGGIFQTQQQVTNWQATHTDQLAQTSQVGPGDVYFKDLRSAPTKPGTFYSNTPDGVIDAYDQVNLGNTIPKYYYGLNFSVEWKGFDLYTQFTGVGGVYKHDDFRAALMYSPSEGANLSTKVLNAWTPQNKSTTIPRMMLYDPAGDFRYSNMFVEKAGYLRLANFQIGYTLPKRFYDLTHNAISNVRLYIAGTNIFTITPYQGLDPENDNFPAPRTFSFGANIRL
jgi:TonB-linked SusC/RagA family outer membrane protein